jgi:hypothetical protein
MSLTSLVEQVRQSTDYQKNKIRLREQIQTDLLIAHESGLFQITPELIAFLSCWDQDELYLEDHYGNPVKCNRPVLLESCKQQYQRVINRWHTQYEQLQQIRKI